MQVIDFNNAIVYGDEKVIERAAASGIALDTVNIEGYSLDADVLAKLWLEADRRIDDGSALLYAAVKQAIKLAHESEEI